MATFSVVILPAKKMANNKHKIRIMVSHNSQTRYIVTDITLNSIDELKNGRVVKRDDKDILNLKIKKLFDMYFGRYMEIETADALTCTQLIKMISKPLLGEKHRKVEDVVDEYLSQIDKDDREKSHKLYKLAANKFLEFTGPGSLMEHITPIRINQYIIYLTKSKLSSTTINIYITLLKVIINYAIKMKYVNYEVDPFVTAKIPAAKKRETQITVDELKAIRDTDFSAYNLNVTRDIFMLTYYLAGMNLVDMLSYNFKNEQIEYVRKKTAHTKDGDSLICFNIPDEAKPLIKKYMNKNTGKIVFGNYKNYVSCYNLLARKMKELGRIVESIISRCIQPERALYSTATISVFRLVLLNTVLGNP